MSLGSAEKPLDKDGNELTLAHLKSLETARYSVPIGIPIMMVTTGRMVEH